MNEALTASSGRRIAARIGLVVACVVLPIVAWAQWTTSSNDIYNSNSGNVGIGTSSPSTKLHIDNTSTSNTATTQLSITQSGIANIATALRLTAQSSGDLFRTSIVNNGTEQFVISSSVKVGIGTTAPSQLLEVSGSSEPVIAITNTGMSGTPSLIFSMNSGNNAALFQVTSGKDFKFYNGQYALTMLGANGNVGIGTTSPSEKLEVNGNVTVSGNISAKYQDLAEWVPTDQVLSSGSVVVLAPGRRNSVIPSFSPYDTRVAGVASANPGITLGEAGEGKAKIATTGRVKVRVDATTAPIEVGDLLVTSTKEGMAMRSEPVNVGGIEIHRPGTLIGKALEPLESGEGEILVLLSLQ